MGRRIREICDKYELDDNDRDFMLNVIPDELEELEIDAHKEKEKK